MGGAIKDDTLTIDAYVSDKKIEHAYIKADVEGAECALLVGAEKTAAKIDKILLCAYHRRNDERELRSRLESYGFSVTVNDHYMLFSESVHDFRRPYLRRGIIYGSRNEK